MIDEVIIQTLTDKVNFINDEVKRTGNNLADLIVCIDAEVLVHALKFIHRLQDENKGLMERGEIIINSLHETIDKQKDEIERQKEEFKTDYKNSWKNKFFTALKENQELQKQVDELNAKNEHLDSENTRLICEMDKMLDDGWDIMDEEADGWYKKGGKDTAKEISQMLKKYFGNSSVVTLHDIQRKIEKMYGVEVE